MAEEKPSIHIDSDWKKQAQEEKRRLAEQEQQRRAQAPAAAPSPGPAAAPAGGRRQRGEARQQLPEASFGSLVQTLATQALYYLGELSSREGDAGMNLDMAKHQIDTMAILEEKTLGNLTEEEKHLLDAALYEVRMRFVSIASQVASYP